MTNCPKCRTRVRKSSGSVCPTCSGPIEQPEEIKVVATPKTAKK